MHVHLYSLLHQCDYHQWYAPGCNTKFESSVSKKHTGISPHHSWTRALKVSWKLCASLSLTLRPFLLDWLLSILVAERKRIWQSSLGLVKLLSRSHIAPSTYISLAKASHMAKPKFKLAGKCSPIMCWGQGVRVFINVQNVYHRREMQRFRQYFSIQLCIKNEREDSKLLSSQKTIQERR